LLYLQPTSPCEYSLAVPWYYSFPNKFIMMNCIHANYHDKIKNNVMGG
jgi:hypothetical protein